MSSPTNGIQQAGSYSVSSEAEPLLNGHESEQQLRSDASPQGHDVVDCAASTSSSQATPVQHTSLKSLGLRIATAMFAFLVMGLIQSSVGVMIPQLEEFYGLNDTLVSLIFLSAPLGYFIAAYMNSFIHLQLGQRGIATIGPACQLVYAIALSTHPPYPVLLAFYVIGGFGTGLLDGSWCAWSGGLEKNANTVQGFLHGSYSVGASLGPFMAGTMLSVGQTPWFHWFYVVSAFCLVELATSVFAFRRQDATKYRAERHGQDSSIDEQDTWAVFKHLTTWICALYFLAYVGIETAITGWIVVFMIRTRHATPYLASTCSSLFNIGMAVGRLSLGALTDRLGVRSAVILYLTLAAILQALFAMIEVQAVSAVILTMIGFLLGPMFPSGVVMIARLLPKNLHVGAVSFVASIGQVGGALVPFALGAIADRLGVGAFQYIILVQLIVTLLVWMCFPRLDSKASTVDHASQESTE